MATGGEPSAAAAVSIKPAKFDETAPTSWFAIIEAQFHISNITVSATRFYHALSHLPTATVSQLPESIITTANYQALRDAVIQHHEATKPELFERFIRDTPLVGRPSRYLTEMRKVASKVGVSDEFIRHRFQQALPQTMTVAVAE